MQPQLSISGPAPDPSSALKRGPAIPAKPPRLPYCIPLCWTTVDGQQRLAYPRRGHERTHYLVMRLGTGTMAGDTLAVVDDFGNLVETHVRSALGFFHPLQQVAA